jgi:hypothetical protein
VFASGQERLSGVFVRFSLRRFIDDDKAVSILFIAILYHKRRCGAPGICMRMCAQSLIVSHGVKWRDRRADINNNNYYMAVFNFFLIWGKLWQQMR